MARAIKRLQAADLEGFKDFERVSELVQCRQNSHQPCENVPWHGRPARESLEKRMGETPMPRFSTGRHEFCDDSSHQNLRYNFGQRVFRSSPCSDQAVPCGSFGSSIL